MDWQGRRKQRWMFLSYAAIQHHEAGPSACTSWGSGPPRHPLPPTSPTHHEAWTQTAASQLASLYPTHLQVGTTQQAEP